MEDLAKLQKRWEEAFESMPKLYETPEGLMVNFTLSEDTDTILFKEPWENFELEDDEEAEFSKSWSKAEWIITQIIGEGFARLGLISYFTAGVKEVRAWRW